MVLKQRMRGLVLILVTGLAACSGGRLQAGATADGNSLLTCPDSPNCVSSRSAVDSQQVEPLRYDGDPSLAHQRLLIVLKGLERVRILQTSAASIHAEFRSAVFGFVDYVDFRFEPPGEIQVRSASRVGYSDFGVNRRRIEEIRARFNQNAAQ